MPWYPIRIMHMSEARDIEIKAFRTRGSVFTDTTGLGSGGGKEGIN